MVAGSVTVERADSQRLVFRTEDQDRDGLLLIGEAVQAAGKLVTAPRVTRDHNQAGQIRIAYVGPLAGFQPPREVVMKRGRTSKELFTVRPSGL